MLSQHSALLLLQQPTLVAEDIGKLTDSVQQLAVGDFHGIPRLVPFPGKKGHEVYLLLHRHYNVTVTLQTQGTYPSGQPRCPHPPFQAQSNQAPEIQFWTEVLQ